MADVDTQSPLIAGIDKAIEEIEQRVRQQQESEQAAPGGVSRGGGAVGAAPISPQESIEDLSVFLSRLRQIRDWLQTDNRLLPVVDEFIGKKVAASEKRSNRNNLVLAGVTTVGGAILGWLVSAFGTPDVLLHLIGR